MSNRLARGVRLRFASLRTLPPALSGILAVLRLLPRVSVPMTIGLAVGVAVSTLLPLGFTVESGFLVGSIPPAVRTGLDSSAGRHTLVLLAGAALLIVGERQMAPLLTALAANLGRLVDRHLQERVMAAVGHPRGIGHLEDPATLDLIEGAQGLGTQGIRPGDGVAALASLLPSWLQVVGSALILATFRWWLGLAWLIAWPVLLYYLQSEYIRVGQAGAGQAGALRRADYYRDLALTAGPAKEVRLWTLPNWIVDRYQAAWRGAMEPAWQARQPTRTVIWSATAIVAVADLAAYALLASAAVHGEIGLAALAIYSRAVINASSFRAFDTVNMHLVYAAVAVPSLLALETRLAVHDAPGSAILPPHSPSTGICFQGVTFQYSGQSARALDRLDLSIPAGESLAIVGANGAGKTTIVKLLCRLYDPTEGALLVDGVDLSQVDPGAWRSQVAAIFQDFGRYHLSARDNVALGVPAQARDLDRLRQAARKAGALELIESLPCGWDTVLSRQYADGVDLSGGEWQRIALARSLFAVEGGARVLILDEPTANLDVRAEAEIYDRFVELTAGLTTILISHRFSTVRRAHRIVVLENGRIAEQGTHAELMELGGTYAHMFRLQAERFADSAVTVQEGSRYHA